MQEVADKPRVEQMQNRYAGTVQLKGTLRTKKYGITDMSDDTKPSDSATTLHNDTICDWRYIGL